MLFERLRRLRLRARDPAARRAAVVRADAAGAGSATLREMVLQDPDVSVRAAAVKRLDELALLRGCYEDDSDALVRETARARYRQLLAGGGDLDLAARLAELDRCADGQILAHVARSGREEALRSAALERISDPGVLEETALQDARARLRQQAVQRLADHAALERVARRARGSDRRVARLARERLSGLAAASEAQATADREAARIVEALRMLVDGGERAGHAGRARLVNRWQQLSPAPGEDHRQAFEEALARVDRWLAEDAAVPASVETPATPAVAMPAAVENHGAPAPSADADTDVHATPVAPPAHAPPCGGEERAASERALADAEAALAAGRLREARRALAAVAEPESALPGELRRRHARARAQVAEWQDWRRFAVQPKQAELCEEAERLALQEDLAPGERLARARRLRRAWRAIGGSATGAERELWQRFQAAVKGVESACAPWLEAEREREQAAVAEREALVGRLQAYLDDGSAEAADLDTLVRVRQAARSEWQARGRLPARLAAPVGARFEPLMDRLTAIIEERREAVAARKGELAEAAEALAGRCAGEPEAAATEALALQRRWRAAGALPRGRERRLWRRFRGACDRIFEARDTARERDRERRREAAASAEATCARIEQDILTLAGADPDAAAQALAAAEAEFAGLELPAGRRGEGIRRRFRGARARVHGALEDARCGQRLALLTAGDEAAVTEALGEEVMAALAAARAEAGGEAPAAGRRRRLCVQLELLTGLESPTADAPLRRELQLQRLVSVQGGAAPEPRPWLLAAEWAGLAGPQPPEEEAGRVRRALRALGGAPAAGEG